MKLRLERVFFPSILALALLASACEPVSVPPWPYTTATDNDAAATDDGGTSDDGAADDGAADDGGDMGMSGAGGIQATYGYVPLRCDGGLCNTDNYSLCNIADRRAASGAGLPLSLLVAAGIGIGIARKRHRRKARRSS